MRTGKKGTKATIERGMEMSDNPQTSPQAPGNQPDMESQPEMCCDGKTPAEEHRKSSPDGKCCVDK